MVHYIARRLLIAVPVLLGILTINFLLFHAAPGGPMDRFLDPNFDPEVVQRLKEDYGLDQPLWDQYVAYLDRVILHFDFAHSFSNNVPVSRLILERLPNTLQLMFLALLLQFTLGIALGVFSAVKQYSRFDHTARIGSLVLYSMPSFYLGMILIFLFAGGVSWLRILPPSGIHDIVSYGEMSGLEKLWDRLRHLVLPVLTLGLGSAASVSRYMRGEMLEVIRQDYMRTARAKGLPERTVILKHGLRNALLPIVTLFGVSLPFLLGGSVIVENLFGWQGMGRLVVDAAHQRDYPVFLAVNLMFATMVLLGTLLADILYAVVDPRIRLS